MRLRPFICALIERINKGLQAPKQGMVRRKNSPLYDSFLLCRNSIRKDLSHIAHKRRNAHFNGLWWVNTPPQPLTAHTAAHRAKQGRFGWGCYHYPRSVPHVHKHPRAGCQNGVLCRFGILAGRCSRRTQKAFGTAMRLCVSLSRGVAAPLGCAVLVPLFVQYDLEGWKDLTKRSGRVTITRNNRTTSRLALVWKPRWAVK